MQKYKCEIRNNFNHTNFTNLTNVTNLMNLINLTNLMNRKFGLQKIFDFAKLNQN